LHAKPHGNREHNGLPETIEIGRVPS